MTNKEPYPTHQKWVIALSCVFGVFLLIAAFYPAYDMYKESQCRGSQEASCVMDHAEDYGLVRKSNYSDAQFNNISMGYCVWAREGYISALVEEATKANLSYPQAYALVSRIMYVYCPEALN